MAGPIRIGIYPSDTLLGPSGINGTYRSVYQLTPQLPDAATEYAYMTFGMPMHYFRGPGQIAGNAPSPVQRPSYAIPDPGPVAPIPTTPGMLDWQGLTGEPR